MFSTHVTESTEVLDSGFRPSGFRIPTLRIPDSELIGFLIPNQIWIPDSIIVDSGFQQPEFAGFWIPDSGFRILLHESKTTLLFKVYN